MTTHLCFIHGWAVNGAVFNDFRARLPEHWHTSAPHLLGHGDDVQDFNIAAAAERLANHIAEPTVWFGWSLGGLVALHLAARYPERVKGLILCSTFARFQAAPDYPQGVNAHMMQRMANFLQQDYPQYLRQFLELQLLHTPNRNELLASLLPDITRYGTPAALQSALNALEQADARPLLSQITAPTLLLYGGKDAITPPRMGEYLAAHLPNAELHIADKAAHAPFLSHADWSAEQVQTWVAQHLQAA